MIMKKRKNVHKDPSEVILDVVKWVVVITFTILCIYPFYYVLIYSISDATRAAEGIWLLPKGFSLETYRKLLSQSDIWQSFFVSVARTGIGTALCLLFTSMLAFLVTRKEMLGRKYVYRFVVFTMYLNAGLIPWYLTMRAYGLKNNFLLYVLPGAVNAYYMILIKTFIEQLPESLEESAILEGAGTLNLFFKIIMPLSKPITATVAVYCAVAQWNSWQDNFFLVQNPKLLTMQLMLRNYLNSAESMARSAMTSGIAAADMANIQNQVTPQSVRMTIIVITILPIMLVYPFAQKYFTKGIMMGAVKG